jgi:hypothetical protein
MRTAYDIARVDSVILGVPEERILRLLGEYVAERCPQVAGPQDKDYYLRHPDAVVPFGLESIDGLGDFAEFAGQIIRTQEEEFSTGREQRLLDGGWKILANDNDSVFVVESPYGGLQVLHFYSDGMVEGYFLSSLPGKARNKLLNDPVEEFVGNFYVYCGGIDADWCTKEEYL